VTAVDLETATITYVKDETEATAQGQIVIGTDGAGSVVRRSLMAKTTKLLFNYSQDFLRHGYKELSIHPDADGSWKIHKEALHIWPRGEFMIIALPNLDGSFTLTMFHPYEGEAGFNTLNTPEKVKAFFEKYYPSLIPYIPHYIEEYFENPVGTLGTIKCYPWSAHGKTLIMGDAAHAIVPFYGQGMNASLEDVRVFDIAIDNFYEMRDHVDDEDFKRKRKIEMQLEQEFPKYYSKYSLVTFRSDLTYRHAMVQGRAQDEELLKMVMQEGHEDLTLEDYYDGVNLRIKISLSQNKKQILSHLCIIKKIIQMKNSTLLRIIRTLGFIVCPALLFVSCDDTSLYEDVDIAIEQCQADSLVTVEAIVIGQVDYYRSSTRRQLPVETEDGLILFDDYESHQFFYNGQEQYTFDQGPCFQYTADGDEIIVRNGSKFYRYSPSGQVLTTIYESDNFVMDFSLTPGHGLCILEGEAYFPDGHQDKWLRYFDFDTQSVETIFHYDDIIRYSPDRLRAIGSYIEDGVVYANLHTHHPDPEVDCNSSMFHRINVTEKRIEHQVGSVNTTIHVSDNFDNSSMFTADLHQLAEWKIVDLTFDDLSEINSYSGPESGNYTSSKSRVLNQYQAALSGPLNEKQSE